MAGGSAGTLTVTMNAKVNKTTFEAAKTEARALGDTVVVQSRRAAQAGETMGRGWQMGTGTLVRSARAGVVGLALLSTASTGVAGDLQRLAGGVATGFATGGPAGAALMGIGELIQVVSRRVGEATEKSEAFRQKQAAIAAESKQYMASLSERERQAGMTESERTKDARVGERVEAMKKGGQAAYDKVIAIQRAEDERAAKEADQQKQDEAAKQAAADKSRFAAEAKAYHDSPISERSRQRDAQREYENKLVADKKKAAEDEKKKIDELNEKVARNTELRARGNEAIRRSVELARAASDVEKLRVRQSHELADAARDGLNVDELRVRHALEMNALLAQQAVETQTVATAAHHAALAETERAKAVKDAAAEEAKRQKQEKEDRYRSGYGPLAQARDGKRAERNLRRLQRHEDNLNAERRGSMSYGTVRDDGNDPLTSDLGSWFEQRERRKKQSEEPTAVYNPHGQWFRGVNVPGGGGDGAGGGTASAPPSVGAVTPADSKLSSYDALFNRMNQASAGVKGGGEQANEAAGKLEETTKNLEDGAGGMKRLADAVTAFEAKSVANQNEIREIAENAARAIEDLLAKFDTTSGLS